MSRSMMSTAGSLASEKRIMIIFNSHLRGDKSVAISKPRRRGPNHVRQPARRVRFAFEAQIPAADHVHEHHGFHAPEIAGKRHARGQFAAAVSIVRILPFSGLNASSPSRNAIQIVSAFFRAHSRRANSSITPVEEPPSSAPTKFGRRLVS